MQLSITAPLLLGLLRALPRQTLGLPRSPVTLGKPRGRLLHLYYVDNLLSHHDGEADYHADPRHGRIHLVRARGLHGASREGRGEEQAGLGRSRCSRVEGGGVGGVGKERGAQERRGEGEEVEGDEEDLVHAAECEENPLASVSGLEGFTNDRVLLAAQGEMLHTLLE
jgi:hypothetical protein